MANVGTLVHAGSGLKTALLSLSLSVGAMGKPTTTPARRSVRARTSDPRERVESRHSLPCASLPPKSVAGSLLVGRKVCTTIYLEAEQVAALKRLKARTRVPISAFIREGIDDVLQRYGELKDIEEVST